MKSKSLLVFMSVGIVGLVSGCDLGEPPHSHEFVAGEIITPATCTTAGEQEYVCSCGETETRSVDALGHSCDKVNGQAATHTEDGWEDYYQCSACDKYFEDADGEIAIEDLAAWKLDAGKIDAKANDHTFGDWTQTKDPTCTEKGEETRSCACGHSETRDVDALGHSCVKVDGQAATHTEDGWEDYYKCSRCEKLFEEQTGTTEIANLEAWKAGDGKIAAKVNDHTFGEWSQTKDPTCTEKGEETRSCVCGHSETRDVEALGHSCVKVDGQAATHTEDGWEDYYQCSACDKYFEDADGEIAIEDLAAWKLDAGKIDAKANDHTFGDWTQTTDPTCTEKGEETRTCACGETETRPIDALGHSCVKVDGQAATHTEDGWEDYYKCSACDEYFEDADGEIAIEDLAAWKLDAGKIDAKANDHTFGDWTQTTDPTCTEKGEETRTCACGETETRPVDALGHSCVKVDGQAATKDAAGWKDYYKCSRCEALFKDADGNNPIENLETWKTEEGSLPIGDDVEISTSNSAKWTSSAKSGADHNEIVVGSGPYYGSTAGSGAYLELRTYQWSEWDANVPGVVATYDSGTRKTVNGLQFKYYLNKNTEFKANHLTVKISIIGDGKTTLIDTLEIDKSTAVFDSVIDYSKTFDNLVFEKLQIETVTNEAKGFSGNTCIFFKEVSARFIVPVEKGTVNVSTADTSLWTCTAKEATNKILVGTAPYWDPTGNPEGSGVYLSLRTYQYLDWNPDQAGLKATYTNSLAKTVNRLSFKYYVNSGSFVANQLTLKITLIGGGKISEITSLVLKKNEITMDSIIDLSIQFDDTVFESLVFETITNEPKGTNGNSCVFIKEIVANYAD